MAKIGLDVGHGKNTFPANGKGIYKGGKGYAEFNFNQMVGKKLKAKLESVGHTIVLGQPFDSNDVSLTARTNKYNAENVDLVVSIHADANNNPSANGRYYFYWHNHAPSKRLALAIAKEVKAKGYDLRTADGTIASVPNTWTDFHINRMTKAPAILGENGFMTGSKDFELIFGSKQEQYTTDIADAYFKGIQAYLGQTTTPKPVAKPASKPVATRTETYSETGTFYPNTTIIVRDQPSTKGNIITRYYRGEHVTYHTVHKANGYVWLQYNRANGRQGYIPCREWYGGKKYGDLWGRIR